MLFLKARNFIFLFLPLLLSCTGELVFSSLTNTRLQLLIKGTYETNDPENWLPDFFNDDGYETLKASVANSNFDTMTSNHTPSDLQWYIDLAEVRLARGQGRSSRQEPEDYWQFVSQDRTLLCSQYAALQNRTLKNCREQKGIEKLQQFFQEGFFMKANDIRQGYYNHLALYFRKIITSPAALFSENGQFLFNFTATFENRGVEGYDIEERYQVPIGGSTTPLMFPLERKDLRLEIPNDEEPFVLEVRIFLKNNIMRHVIKTTFSNGIVYFLAPSDFYHNHLYDNSVEAGRLGNNIAFTARTYKLSQTGSVDVSGITIAGASTISYLAAIPMDITFDPSYSLAYAATKVTGLPRLIKNLPIGSYHILALCDKKRRGVNNTLQNGQDGYPETASPACATVNITPGAVVDAGSATCTCP